MEEGGYDFEIVGHIVEDYYCPVCMLLLRDAVEIPDCFHTMCGTCMKKWSQECHDRGTDSTCPKCNVVYKPSAVPRARALDRIIKTTIKVKCKLGCSWSGMISNVQDHEKRCTHVRIDCTFDGCKEQVAKSNFEKHQNNCQYRMIKCEHCGIEVVFIQNNEHLEACQHCPVVCPNKDCGTVMSRELMNEHVVGYCQYELVTCKYNALGCDVKFLRNVMKEHNKIESQKHMDLILAYSMKINDENSVLRNEVDCSRKEQEQLEKRVKALEGTGNTQPNSKCPPNIKSVDMLNLLFNSDPPLFKSNAYDLRIEELFDEMKSNWFYKVGDDYYLKVDTNGHIKNKIYVSICNDERSLNNRRIDTATRFSNDVLCLRVYSGTCYIDVFSKMVKTGEVLVSIISKRWHMVQLGTVNYGIWGFDDPKLLEHFVLYNHVLFKFEKIK